MSMSDGDLARVEYIERLCELMHRHSAHELVVGDVHIALHPRVQTAAGDNASKPLPSPMIPLRVPSEEEMLFWSSPLAKVPTAGDTETGGQ